jgi:hypothetical protein
MRETWMIFHVGVAGVLPGDTLTGSDRQLLLEYLIGLSETSRFQGSFFLGREPIAGLEAHNPLDRLSGIIPNISEN